MATLVIHKGSDKGTSYDIDPPTVFGRHESSDIKLSDSKVSRNHGKITRQDGIFYLEDLDSSNGTKINDVPIQRKRLENGDRIQVGSTELLFQLDKQEQKAYKQEQSTPTPKGGASSKAKKKSSIIPGWVMFLLSLIFIGGVFLGSYYVTMQVLPMLFE